MSSTSSDPTGPRLGRLGSWKEIAAHFGCDVRTVQRWERREGLPVHRHQHEKLASVHAFVDELEAWRASRTLAPESGDEPGVGAPPLVSEPSAPPAIRAPPRRWGWSAAMIALAVIGAVLIARFGGPAGDVPAIESVAVLPFDNLSGDPSQDYIADGLTDAVTSSIARIPSLSVTARTSVRQFASAEVPVPDIARRLGVDALIEGSVVRSGSRLRVNVQLVAADSRTLWSETYDRSMGDVLALQDDIARGIVRRTRATLASAATPGARAIDPKAWESWQRGRALWAHRTPEGTTRARELLREAIAVDPGFAEAHASLAETFVAEPWQPEGRAAAGRAIELDPDLGAGHAALGAILLCDLRWDEARRELDRALELNPSDVEARTWRAQYFLAVGCVDQAIAELRIARRLDPVGSVTGQALGTALYLAGDAEGARRTLAEVIEVDPSFPWARYRLGQVEWSAGHRVEGERLLAGAAPVRRAASLAAAGHGAEAAALLEPEPCGGAVSCAFDAAAARAALGDADAAFAELERAWAGRDANLHLLMTDPRLEAIRGDARYEALLHRMGLLPRRACS